MAELIVKYCGGEARTILLDVTKELAELAIPGRGLVGDRGSYRT
jgi:hypothetical protein